VVSSDFLVLDFLDGLSKRQDGAINLLAGGGGLELLSSGVVDLTLLGLTFSAGEENELVLVLVETLSVSSQSFLAGVGSSGVDSDTNSTSEFGGETGSLKFLLSETTSISDLADVLAGGAVHNGSELLERARESSSGLSGTNLSSALLVCGLVEVSFDSSLPVLAKVNVWNNVVVFDHFADILNNKQSFS